MAQLYRDHINLTNGDKAYFVPPEPTENSLGGITKEQQTNIDKITTLENDITSLQAEKQDTISDIQTIRSGAAAGATAVQTETDPTVPEWAKANTKPSYTAAEVGAVADNKFELMETIQLEQAVSYIRRDMSYKNVFVTIETPSQSESTSAEYLVVFNGDSDYSSVYMGNVVQASKAIFSACLIENINGRYFIRIFLPTNSIGNAYSTLTQYNAFGYRTSDTIIRLQFTNATLPAGTIIKIYGAK